MVLTIANNLVARLALDVAFLHVSKRHLLLFISFSPSEAHAARIFLQARVVQAPTVMLVNVSKTPCQISTTYCFTGRAPAQEPLFSVWYSYGWYSWASASQWVCRSSKSSVKPMLGEPERDIGDTREQPAAEAVRELA